MSHRLTPKERRLQRDLERKTKAQEKNARLANSVTITNNLRSAVIPPFTKTPRTTIRPDSYKKFEFTWCKSISDEVGQWSWHEPRSWTNEEYQSNIINHFNSVSNKSWNEVEDMRYNGKRGVRKRLHKHQPTNSICNEAQRRWSELEFDQYEEMFKLRLGSTKRIWGIRIKSHFYMIWYEREHKICPVD